MLSSECCPILTKASVEGASSLNNVYNINEIKIKEEKQIYEIVEISLNFLAVAFNLTTRCEITE